ncbi:MAG: hypothetical protein DRG63_10850 [Deltaproteobacteria bacterium]|nr:MAG: hypothetical protein DRG63_10850 [Deltaproteobacteria bacterium]
MWTLEQIESKCYELAEGRANGLFIKAYEKPQSLGWQIAIWKNQKAYETEPVLGEFFLDEVYATACFRNGNCSKWKTLLIGTLTGATSTGNGDGS